ncbi:MAG TPA: DUF2461 domain-containing protein [Bacteroidales bacterium]|nr:DUF2461 domain-containing protein [Bacteroidales bacterium]HRZ47832.1 DUF2461 domain-containing protein [Bacteroidales bacterium]
MFSKTYLQFFIDLAANNNTAWFNEHRKTYEKEVKEPFTKFVAEMIKRIQQHEPEVQIKPGDAIMRINNDIRFSKDKTPYKLHMCANISEFGKRNLGYPGFFFQLSPENIQIYGGVYMVDNPMLLKIRQYMAGNLDALAQAYRHPDFMEKFGTIQGEQRKRLVPEFQAILHKEPLIANKQYYYGATLPAETITNPHLPDILMAYYLAGRGVNRFFQEAMK